MVRDLESCGDLERSIAEAEVKVLEMVMGILKLVIKILEPELETKILGL